MGRNGKAGRWKKGGATRKRRISEKMGIFSPLFLKFLDPPLSRDVKIPLSFRYFVIADGRILCRSTAKYNNNNNNNNNLFNQRLTDRRLVYNGNTQV